MGFVFGAAGGKKEGAEFVVADGTKVGAAVRVDEGAADGIICGIC